MISFDSKCKLEQVLTLEHSEKETNYAKELFFITALKAVNMKSYFKKYAIKFV